MNDADKSRQELLDELAELRETQEQLIRREKLAVLGQMANSVGHELRNPLATISNAIYYLKIILPDADETVAEYLDIVAGETRNAEKMISDLLGFARIKSLVKEDVDVLTAVEMTLERCTIPDTIQVRLDIPAELPEVVFDRRQLEQVLLNLAANACEAMPDGGELTIRATHTDSQILLSVEDSGVGISSEHLDKLFEPLFSTKTKGIGLGLAIVQNLIEANRGRIEVESEEGKGTIFTIALPISQHERS